MQVTSMLVGASGLIGQHLLRELEKDSHIQSVHVISRNKVNTSSNKVQQYIHPTLILSEQHKKHIAIDVGYICLGTTKKQAGSNKALYKVDVELVIQMAQLMQELGAKRIVVVSSLGANANSLSHYLRCKGIMQQQLIKMNIKNIDFMQPGPLVGTRVNIRKDEIIIQRCMALFAPLMKKWLIDYQPIEADLVAKCMLKISLYLPAPQKNKSNKQVKYYTKKTMLQFFE